VHRTRTDGWRGEDQGCASRRVSACSSSSSFGDAATPGCRAWPSPRRVCVSCQPPSFVLFLHESPRKKNIHHEWHPEIRVLSIGAELDFVTRPGMAPRRVSADGDEWAPAGVGARRQEGAPARRQADYCQGEVRASFGAGVRGRYGCIAKRDKLTLWARPSRSVVTDGRVLWQVLHVLCARRCLLDGVAGCRRRGSNSGARRCVYLRARRCPSGQESRQCSGAVQWTPVGTGVKTPEPQE
jgi:hypothetical protein